MATSSQERWQRWYKTHGKALKARRRARYKASPKVRRTEIGRVQDRYWKNRMDRLEARFAFNVETANYTTGGVPAYTLDEVAKMFGRARRTLASWITMGVLPAPVRHADGSRHRVYTMREVLIMRDCSTLLAQPKKDLRRSDFAVCVNKAIVYLRRQGRSRGTAKKANRTTR